MPSAGFSLFPFLFFIKILRRSDTPEPVENFNLFQFLRNNDPWEFTKTHVG